VRDEIVGYGSKRSLLQKSDVVTYTSFTWGLAVVGGDARSSPCHLMWEGVFSELARLAEAEAKLRHACKASKSLHALSVRMLS